MIDLLLQFFCLLLQIPRAARQRLFLWSISGGLRTAVPKTAHPLAQLEGCKEEQTYQGQGGINNARAYRPQHPENIVMQCHSDEAADTGSANRDTRATEQ